MRRRRDRRLLMKRRLLLLLGWLLCCCFLCRHETSTPLRHLNVCAAHGIAEFAECGKCPILDFFVGGARIVLRRRKHRWWAHALTSLSHGEYAHHEAKAATN